MRVIRLLNLVGPIAMLLPLSTHADSWPSEAKESYMKDCIRAASQSIDLKTARQHCACSTQIISEKFSTVEIKELISSKKRPSVELRTKALDAIQACRATK